MPQSVPSARQMRRRSILYWLLIGAAGAVALPHGRVGAETIVSEIDSTWIAKLAGRQYTAAEFARYLESIRDTGYRPATVTEAERLLQRFLGERLLELEAERRGYPIDAEGLRTTWREVRLAHADEIAVTDHDVDVYLQRRSTLGSTPGAAGSAARRDARRQLVQRREAIQREALLAQLLKQSQLEINHSALAATISQPTRPAERPPVPPGFLPAAPTSERPGT